MSLPGDYRKIQSIAARCDHCEKLATYVMQGETDSFGAEYHMLCDEHFKLRLDEIEKEKQKPKLCEWCNKEKVGCTMQRDITESHGPLYQVCNECRVKNVNAFVEDEYD